MANIYEGTLELIGHTPTGRVQTHREEVFFGLESSGSTVTAAIQSYLATTVMVVGLCITQEKMNFRQAIGNYYGCQCRTTTSFFFLQPSPQGYAAFKAPSLFLCRVCLCRNYFSLCSAIRKRRRTSAQFSSDLVVLL